MRHSADWGATRTCLRWCWVRSAGSGRSPAGAGRPAGCVGGSGHGERSCSGGGHKQRPGVLATPLQVELFVGSCAEWGRNDKAEARSTADGARGWSKQQQRAGQRCARRWWLKAKRNKLGPKGYGGWGRAQRVIQALAVIGPVFLDASKTPAIARALWRPSTVTQDDEDNERSHRLLRSRRRSYTFHVLLSLFLLSPAICLPVFPAPCWCNNREPLLDGEKGAIKKSHEDGPRRSSTWPTRFDIHLAVRTEITGIVSDISRCPRSQRCALREESCTVLCMAHSDRGAHPAENIS